MKGFFKSSIGKKVIMSVSGLFLILFLLFHLCMNLVVVFSPCAYNEVCAFLGAHWYAVAGTLVLAAGFLLHIIYAFVLTVQNRKARGNDRYDSQNLPKDVEFASKNMLVLGIIIACGLLTHFGQFWAKMMYAELAGCEGLQFGPTQGAQWINYYFHDCGGLSIALTIVYLVWFAALWLHLNHGFWSAFHTVGLSNNLWIPRLKCIAKWFSTIICAGFAFIVIWAAAGAIDTKTPCCPKGKPEVHNQCQSGQHGDKPCDKPCQGEKPCQNQGK